MNQGDKYSKLYKYRPEPKTSHNFIEKNKERFNARNNNFNLKRNIEKVEEKIKVNPEPVLSMKEKLERFKKERDIRRALIKKQEKPIFKAGIVRHNSTWTPPPPPPQSQPPSLLSNRTRRQPLRKINCDLKNNINGKQKTTRNNNISNKEQKNNKNINKNEKKIDTYKLPQNYQFKPLDVFKNYKFVKSEFREATITSPFARETKKKSKNNIDKNKEELISVIEHKLNESFTISINNDNQDNLEDQVNLPLNNKKNEKEGSSSKKSSTLNLNESYTINDDLNITVEHDVNYFRELMNTETTKIMTQVNQWTQEKDTWNLTNSLMKEPEEQVMATIGQAKLLCNNKLKQFSNLIDRCESGDTNGKGELAGRIVTCQDLEGFWGMISMQVRDVSKRFQELEDSKACGWKKPETRTIKCKKNINKKITKEKKQITKGSGISDFIRNARKNKNPPQEEKIFTPSKKRVSMATSMKSSPIIMRVSHLGKLALTPINDSICNENKNIKQITEHIKTPFSKSILKTPGSQNCFKKRVDFPENDENLSIDIQQGIRRSARISEKKAKEEAEFLIKNRRSSLRSRKLDF